MSRPERADPAVLKRCYPLEEVISRAGVRLRRSGGRLVGCCPFHEERTPSFTVYPNQGSYHCYGCGAHGDVFTFLMATEQCSFPEAVARLTGGDLPMAPRAPAPPDVPPLSEHQQGILTAVAHAYAADLAAARALDAALATVPALDAVTLARLRDNYRVRRANAALAYLRRRGVPDDVLTPELVGWCEGDRLPTLAAERGWDHAELIALGLLDEWGRERLAGRVVVPEVRAGGCVWLIGRTVGPDDPRRPKYLGIRAPRRALGLEAAAGKPAVIVVEGVVDYLVSVGWDLPVLALGGLGLRPDELIALRHVRDVILLLDADRAGQAEATRLAALIGPRARVVHPPPPAKDLADLATMPDGHARLLAALAGHPATPATPEEDRHALSDR
jgi:DNA primase